MKLASWICWRIAVLTAVLVCWSLTARASNPIINTAYSADPSAHVFDGRMYVYASHDRNDARKFDMVDYHVYSSDDLGNWRDHGVAFRLSDSTWAKSHLWAPDCAFKDDKYYLYYPAQDASGKPHIGVAVSTSPAGPFKDVGGPLPGVYGIDPSLFIDEDGTPWLTWAGDGPMLVRMKPDMTELAEPPRKLSGVENFFEGPWIFKRGGLYYYTYPAFRPGGVGRGGHGQNYDYAVARTVTGPYTYKGSFTQSAPGAEGDNIHGSQVEWKGKWYCFYHDFSTSVGHEHAGYKRAVKMDELRFSPDGSILPLLWTATGLPMLHPVNAFERHEAEELAATDVPEGAYPVAVTGDSPGPVWLGPSQPEAWVRYAGFDFGAGGATGLQFRVASATGGGEVEVHLDHRDNSAVGTCAVRYTGGWDRWETQDCTLPVITGHHDIYLIFRGDGHSGLFNLDWFQFTPAIQQ